MPHWDVPNWHCIYSVNRQSDFKLHTYVPQQCQHAAPQTGTSVGLGRPMLALVPQWGQCQFGVSRRKSSSSTGRPVPARGAQFQHRTCQNHIFGPRSSTGRPVVARCLNGAVGVPVPARGENAVPVPARAKCLFGAQHTYCVTLCPQYEYVCNVDISMV